MTKKILTGIGIISAVVVVLALFGLISIKKGEFKVSGASNPDRTNYSVMAGTATQLCRVPDAYVIQNATNTNPAVDGCAVNQVIYPEGVTSINFDITAKGGTATSTLAIRPYGSYDGDNWFPISGTSTSTEPTGTTTLILADKAFIYDFGTATKTKSFTLDIPAVKMLRTVFYGEDVTGDPDDGVKAYIKVGWIE